MKKANFSRAIFRNNRGLSIGLLLVMLLVTVSACFALVMPSSVRTTLERFTEEYGLPDAYITARPSLQTHLEDLKQIEGVQAVQADFSVDTRIRLPDGTEFGARVFGVEEDGFQKFYDFESDGDSGGVWMSVRFAGLHALSAGQTVSLDTPDGFRSLELDKLVTTPNCMVCTRDAYSWNDVADFCFLYLPRQDLDELFGCGGAANLYSFQFEPDTDLSLQKQSMQQAEQLLADDALSTVIYEDSQVKSYIDNELQSMTNAVTCMQVVILLIGLCFCTLFVRQIVEKESKTCAVLRALGYRKKQILWIFIRFTLRVSILALALGAALGACISRYGLEVYRQMFSLPKMIYDIDPLLLAALTLSALLVGVIACLSSADRLLKADPALSFNPAEEEKEPPKFLKKLRVSAFTRIALLSQWKKKARLVQSAACIAVCISLTAMALGLLFSKNAVFPANFGGRFRYDTLVRLTEGTQYDGWLSELDGVSRAEPMTLLRETISFGGETDTVQINALPDECRLTVLSAPDGERLTPEEDGIILEEWYAEKHGLHPGQSIKIGETELIITGIAREFIRSVQYISMQTAQKLGYSEINACTVSLDAQADAEKVYAQIEQTDGVLYQTRTDNQRLSVETGFQALDVVIWVYCAVVLLMGVLLVYNMTAVNISERKYTYAALIALGTGKREFGRMAFLDNLLRYAAAAAAACPLGLLGSRIIRQTMSTLGHSYPPVRTGLSLLLACLMSLSYVFCGVFITIRKIRKIDPAALLSAGE